MTPLREGGSLPAIVEADDDGLYVLKFRGAGQGTRALIAELVSGEIGRALGPARARARVCGARSRTWRARSPIPKSTPSSTTAPGSTSPSTTCPARSPTIRSCTGSTRDLAARIVWFDGYVTNVDRTRAQHQHADVAPRAVADRPRRHAVFPPRDGLGRRRHARPRSVCPARAPRVADARQAARPGGRAAGGRARAEVLEDDCRVDSRGVAGRRRGSATRRRARAPTRATCAPGGCPAVLPAGDACVPPELTYDYVVVRVVPRVERGEQINVGRDPVVRRRRLPRRPHRARRRPPAGARPGARSRARCAPR